MNVQEELDISNIYDNESSKSDMYGLNGSGRSSTYDLNENYNFSDKNDSKTETGGSTEASNGWFDYTQRRFLLHIYICRVADKSLVIPISPTFILTLLSHQSLLFCIFHIHGKSRLYYL
jgi:hypothetical protein